MTTITPDLARHGGNVPFDNYLTHSHGLKSWLFSLDHKRIGVMYLIAVLLSFLAGGIFAMMIRTQLLFPDGAIFTTQAVYKHYNQMFTLHGAIMVFLVLVPGIPSALGNFTLPIMLGAKDVAFPRLNLFSFWLYLIGAAFAIASILIGAVDTGWTFYTPYSVDTETAVSCLVFGVFILGFSSILTGMNFIVTIHKLRPPGMTWFRMPLFLWATYATAIIQVLATPVLGITLLLLIMERVLHIGIFNPAYGGDPVLFQHFFWFYSHPAVYIMILPAMGVMSEVVSTFSRKHIFGYRFIALSSIAIAVIAFLVWGHHMFPNGQSTMLATIFSFLTMLVAIPSAIKVWNWLATMYRGSIDLKTPMCYALAFLFLFSIGGLTGVFLGTLSTDVHLHDTYFVIAHFHYVMFGGTLIGFLAGLHYWWPKMTGKMYNEFAGRVGCALVFVGFNLTFLPQFVMGSLGMPRRYATYLPVFQPYHVMSTMGAYLQFIGFAFTAAYLLHSVFKGKKAPANPWGSATLEWTCTSPPPHDNFKKTPSVGDPYDHSDIVWDTEVEGYVHDPSLAPTSPSSH
ncbi:MAG TPA: cytochrome c oxidase subunit I [Phycisphaerae bacterium]|nr:cytochrome c oxidase subunit I [Phycisphaerae bacterium]